jgi:hypothetical protein
MDRGTGCAVFQSIEMKVRVLHDLQNVAYGNIMYLETGDVAMDALVRFREAGYFASCFPEGDGICFRPLKDQSYDQIESDIREILKFEIDSVKRH